MSRSRSRSRSRGRSINQVGDDEHGSAYRRNLVEQGVDIRHLGEEKGVR